jgi:hypothetical protein
MPIAREGGRSANLPSTTTAALDAVTQTRIAKLGLVPKFHSFSGHITLRCLFSAYSNPRPEKVSRNLAPAVISNRLFLLSFFWSGRSAPSKI